MLSTNCYATVWDPKVETTNTGKTIIKGRISTSQKQQDGTYKQDFSGFVTFVGDAANLQLANQDRVQIENFGVTSYYNKEKNSTSINVTVFKATKQERQSNDNVSTTTSTPDAVASAGLPTPDDFGSDIPDELPFN